MTTSTLTIPQTNLSPGTPHVFGPVTLDASMSRAVVTLSRTAGAHALNSLPSSVSMDVRTDVSLDNGTTWILNTEDTFQGGTFFDDGGVVETNSYDDMPLPGVGQSGRQLRATVTVSGATISLSGSIVVYTG